MGRRTLDTGTKVMAIDGTRIKPMNRSIYYASAMSESVGKFYTVDYHIGSGAYKLKGSHWSWDINWMKQLNIRRVL